MEGKILNGWKEISAHIQRGVRTAQRWEAALGMPVHRPALKDRSAVVAFSAELDSWLVRTAPDAAGRETNDSLAQMYDDINSLAMQLELIYQEVESLHAKISRLEAGALCVAS